MSEDFSGLGLSTKVTEAVIAAGYTKPTDIQAQAIPHVLQKKDIIGIAQTGTGKTASFVLPMLTLLENGRARARMPRTLILEPTRELAAQVHENFEKYGKNHKLSVALLIGGVSFEEQNKKLDRGADVLIATPGRLLDQFERGRILLNGVEILVIDEADRMLDMGFVPDIERICSLLPPRRQTLFFSATMPPEIQKLTSRFLRDPVRIEVARQNSTADTIEQKLFRVSSKPEDKRSALRDQIRAADSLTNAIIFCNRKRDVATLSRSLQRHGFSVGELHGDMDQKSRTDTLDAFKNNRITLLVASDVAARGLDIPAVSHVFNFDVPVHAEDYIHRIGRTGRAGRSGTALTFVAPADSKHLDAITKLIQKDIPYMDDAKPAEAATTEAAESGAPKIRRGRRGAARTRETAPVAEQPNEASVASEDVSEAAEVAPPAPKRERQPRRRPAQTRPEAEAAAAAAASTDVEAADAEPATQPIEPVVTETVAPEPVREAAPPRNNRRPPQAQQSRTPRVARLPKPDEAGIDPESPFGTDGPVPAFLLRGANFPL